MIFLTVGTQFPFDRLVKAVDAAVAAGAVKDDIFAQVEGGWRPVNMRWVDSMDYGEFKAQVARSRAVIGHAGIGTILAALEAKKPLLVMPRLKQYAEVVNDHQVVTAGEFAARGHLLAAFETADLPGKMRALLEFRPSLSAAGGDAIAARIKSFLDSISVRHPRDSKPGTRESCGDPG